MAKFLFLSDSGFLQRQLSEYFKLFMSDKELVCASSLSDAVTALQVSGTDGIISDYRDDFTVGFDLVNTMKESHVDLPFVFFGSQEPDLESVAALRMRPHPAEMVFLHRRDTPEHVVQALNKFAANALEWELVHDLKTHKQISPTAAEEFLKPSGKGIDGWHAEAEVQQLASDTPSLSNTSADNDQTSQEHLAEFIGAMSLPKAQKEMMASGASKLSDDAAAKLEETLRTSMAAARSAVEKLEQMPSPNRPAAAPPSGEDISPTFGGGTKRGS